MNNQQAKQIRDAIDVIMGTKGTTSTLAEMRSDAQAELAAMRTAVRQLAAVQTQLIKRVVALENAEPRMPAYARNEQIAQAKEIAGLQSSLGRLLAGNPCQS